MIKVLKTGMKFMITVLFFSYKSAQMIIINTPCWQNFEYVHLLRKYDGEFLKTIKFRYAPRWHGGSNSLQYPRRSIQDYFANFRK